VELLFFSIIFSIQYFWDFILCAKLEKKCCLNTCLDFFIISYVLLILLTLNKTATFPYSFTILLSSKIVCSNFHVLIA
jgi:hypothetical protein